MRPAPRWTDHALACGLTLFGVPLTGVMLIFVVAPLGDWALPVGLFAMLLVMTVVSAWMAMVPGAVVIAALWRWGFSHPAIAVGLGAAAGLTLAMGESMAVADVATFTGIGAIYGGLHRLILGRLANMGRSTEIE